ncbi:MAG: CPBP family intramembrane glutamic endopeptidase [Asticcacaulis sp.]
MKHRLYLAIETGVVMTMIMAIAFLSRLVPGLPRLPVFGASWTLFVFMLGLMAWLRFRGESLADYGLFRPHWGKAIGVALGVLACMYLYMGLINPYMMRWLAPYVGTAPDLTRFDAVKGDWRLYLEILPMVWLSAGFMEEFIFRGFLVNRMLMIFGTSKPAWIAAALTQAVLFSIGHIYQGWYGVVTIVMVSFFLLLASRLLKGNLWPAIIMHGLIDTLSLGALVLKGYMHLKA